MQFYGIDQIAQSDRSGFNRIQKLCLVHHLEKFKILPGALAVPCTVNFQTKKIINIKRKSQGRFDITVRTFEELFLQVSPQTSKVSSLQPN